MLFCIPRHHNKKKLPPRQLLFHIPHPVPTGLYQRFFKYIDDFYTFIGDFSLYRRFDIGYRLTDNFRQSIYTLYPTTTIKEVTLTATSFPYTTQYQPDYINDFSNISAISTLLSAIFSLYRRFDIGYRLTDNFRQSIYALYPATTIKEVTLSATSFHIPRPVPTGLYQRFSNISIVSPLISTIFHYIGDSTQDIDLTTTFDTRNAQHTLSPSNLLPSSTIKKITNKMRVSLMLHMPL